MLIIYLSVILFGLYSIYATEVPDYVEKINWLLTADQQYPDLTALISNKKSWEGIKKLRATPSNLNTLCTIYKQVYEACKASCVIADGADTSKLDPESSCSTITKEVTYCGRLMQPFFDPAGTDPKFPLDYDSYVGQVLYCAGVLRNAREEEDEKSSGVFKHLSTPGQFIDSLVAVLKNNLGALTFTEDPDLFTEIKKACGVKGESKVKTEKPAGGKDEPAREKNKSDDGKDKPAGEKTKTDDVNDEPDNEKVESDNEKDESDNEKSKSDNGKGKSDSKKKSNLGNKDQTWTTGKKIAVIVCIGAVIIIVGVIVIKRKKE
jgi:hypothetical protein